MMPSVFSQAWHVQLDHAQSDFLPCVCCSAMLFWTWFFKIYFWFHSVFYFLHVLGRQISDKLKMFSGSPYFAVFRQLYCGCQFSDIICFYFNWITWGWKACTLRTINKYRKIISLFTLKLPSKIPKKTIVWHFHQWSIIILVTIWYGIVPLTLNKKKKETWRILSKIGLVKLNVGQKDEFCVKLVAPLLHNQMMWYILK